MNKILRIKQAIELSKKLRKQKKTIVLVGGCFDILHIGHIEFLQKAKEKGGILVVLLESDETIKKLKGKNRPINNQKDRSIILSSLTVVDYIIPLPFFRNNEEYDNLIMDLKPDTIATTKGDLQRIHKERQAKIINAKVVDVIENITNRSTTKLIKLLSQNL